MELNEIAVTRPVRCVAAERAVEKYDTLKQLPPSARETR
jgi:hypothetical protein